MQTPQTDGSYYADLKMKWLFLKPHLSQSDVLATSQTAALLQERQERRVCAQLCSIGGCSEFPCAQPEERLCE